MKVAKKLFFSLFVVCGFFYFTSCEIMITVSRPERKIRVYTDTKNYYVFESESKLSLSDGGFARAEFSLDPRLEPVLKVYKDGHVETAYEYVIPRLPEPEAEYRYSAMEIAVWLERNGNFSPEQAKAQATWLMSVNHGIIVVRNGTAVHSIFH